LSNIRLDFICKIFITFCIYLFMFAMKTFRTLLAILFSFLIVGGIWRYYTSNDAVSVKDPFSAVWKKFATNTGIKNTDETTSSEEDTTEVVVENSWNQKIHEDFTFGTIDSSTLDRLSSLWVVGGNPNGNILWLQYCDFDAIYCQKSFDEWIVYDYLEAYPEELQYIYKSFPIWSSREDKLAHQATMCAMDLWTSKQYFWYYTSVYNNEWARESIDDLIVLAREIGISGFDDCIENTNYDLVFQQDTKLARQTFDLKALPANIFINKTSGDWVLVPWYYSTQEVLPGIEKISK